VKIEFEEVKPPFTLYHGTSGDFLDSIKKEGLHAQTRNFVHLSKDFETATEVAKRRTNPTVLTIHANLMYFDKYKFFK